MTERKITELLWVSEIATKLTCMGGELHYNTDKYVLSENGMDAYLSYYEQILGLSRILKMPSL